MLDHFTDQVNKKKSQGRDYNDWEDVFNISTYANYGNNAIYRPGLNYIEGRGEGTSITLCFCVYCVLLCFFAAESR